jgi:hypothetical protein
MLRSRGTGHLLGALALSAPYLLAHPAATLLDAGLPRSLAVNLVLFLVPGLPIVGVLLVRGWLRRWRLLWVMAAALLVFAASVVVCYLAGWPPTAEGLWTAAWAVTLLAVLLNWRAGGGPAWGLELEPALLRVGLPAFFAAYLLFWWGATRIVPPQADHDMEVQGTAYALLTRLTPNYETPRGGNYLAHPPLLHLYVAGSFLYHGRLEALSVYDPEGPSEQPADWRHYVEHPYFAETRTPSVFLGALTVALLAGWLAGTAGAGLGLLLAATFATLPELFVRFSYGGYFAISAFFALQLTLAVEQIRTLADPGARRTGMLAGGLAAWANHKLLLIPASLALWRMLIARRGGTRDVVRAALHPVVIGFLVGALAFAAYGLWVSPGDFWNDHIRHHIVDRILNTNRRGMDLSVYPGPGGVWLEFWRDTSYLFLPAGMLALARLVIRRPIEAGWGALPGFLFTWVLLSGLAFTVVDWRQTKHLAEVVAPALVVALGLAGAAAGRYRWAAMAGLLLLIGLNLFALSGLAADFEALVKRPEW